MFYKIDNFSEENLITVTDIGDYSLKDTFECGQCFRYEEVKKEENYTEYMTVVKDKVIRVGQQKIGELIFHDICEDDFLKICVPYFSLDTDYEEIRRDILGRTDSAWLTDAAECAKGIAILRQDPWETLFSFIISQNNNIPRIRKIIKKLSIEYGVNISLQNKAKKCPANKTNATPCEEICKECGCCYTFPTAAAVCENPEKLLAANPGFRYKYLCDAAKKVDTGAIDLNKILNAHSYDFTVSELTKINGVGPKVAACCALFGFGNLEAFPIDVWMKRAIDTYFDGHLDPLTLGKYAGVAQQYIFHYIRNIEDN